jgi:hypothetical protein
MQAGQAGEIRVLQGIGSRRRKASPSRPPPRGKSFQHQFATPKRFPTRPDVPRPTSALTVPGAARGRWGPARGAVGLPLVGCGLPLDCCRFMAIAPGFDQAGMMQKRGRAALTSSPASHTCRHARLARGNDCGPPGLAAGELKQAAGYGTKANPGECGFHRSTTE